ncbi:MAG: hypothetical protein CMJ35_01365 [Phycisphaerae bacterium]|nr:hypothetical protein [Phycisphaerae bacterium]HCT44023.1 hypothetical protein [Phycisphaerales bacterium]
MKYRNQIAILMGSVGLSHGLALADEPTIFQPDQSRIIDIAHIYYNLVTGERVISLNRDGHTAAADSGDSVSVWSTRGAPPDCFSSGSTSFFFALDNPGSTPLSTNVTLLDFGDIEKDTVVDCVSVNWIVAHPDTDSDSDSIGDGVEELAGEWTVWDADNGREYNQSTRLPVVNILFYNLPGNVAPPGFLSSYTLDVDLVGGVPGSDLSFELGDTDGDCQGAGFCNSSVFDNATGTYLPIGLCDNDFDSVPDSDLDGDGLFDFGWTVRFYQPGTGNDFDGDMDTGIAAPSDADTIGVAFGYPEGLIELPDGSLDIDPSVSDAGTGAVDLAVLIGSDGSYNNFSFGGYQCPDGDNPAVPAAIFAFQLWGPGGGGCSPADLNGDGQVNFFDVSEFLSCYNLAPAPGCEIIDFNNDGVINFFDVSIFIGLLQDGCP